MKKILAIMMVLFVCAAVFVACGEKKDDTVKEPEKTEDTTKTDVKTEDKTEVAGNKFESKHMSFVLPDGFKAEESEAGINVKNDNDPMKAITIAIQEGNSASVDEVANMTAELLKDTKIEDAKFGNYDYKKLTTSMMGINIVTLINSSNGNLYSFTVNGFEDPEILSIIESVELK